VPTGLRRLPQDPQQLCEARVRLVEAPLERALRHSGAAHGLCQWTLRQSSERQWSGCPSRRAGAARNNSLSLSSCGWLPCALDRRNEVLTPGSPLRDGFHGLREGGSREGRDAGCPGGTTQNNRTALRAREPLAARSSASESASGFAGGHVRNRLEHS
jgi:hypothetical protein